MPKVSEPSLVRSIAKTDGIVDHNAIAAQISRALGFIVDARNTVPGNSESNTPILDSARLLTAAIETANKPAQAKLIINRANRTDKSVAPNAVPIPVMKNGTIGYLPMFVHGGLSMTCVSCKRVPQPG